MDFFEDIINNVWVQRCIWSVIVILISITIYCVISRLLTAKEKKSSRILSDKKNKTFIRMLKSVVAYILAILTLLAILQIFGINVTSMLAGVGIAGIIIGLALQDAMKDIFRGLEIISDGYYGIGDVIKYGDNTGQVLSITLRTTRIQDTNTMNIVSIANRNIDQVEIVSGYIYIKVPLPYELKLEKAEAVIKEAVKALGKEALLNSADYQGVTEFAASSLDYQIVVTCDPINILQARRDSLRAIIATLEENKIYIPYTQLDVHTK